MKQRTAHARSDGLVFVTELIAIAHIKTSLAAALLLQMA